MDPQPRRLGFYADLETQAMKFAKIPPDLDVLISHGPPFGRHDRVSLGDHVGSSALANVVAARTHANHVFGTSRVLTEPAFQPRRTHPLHQRLVV